MKGVFSALVGSTPLHSAVKGCKLAEVQQLTQKGADVDGKDKEGCTALHIAARLGFEPITKELLNRQATASIANLEQVTPVHEAARGGHIGVLKLLLGPQNTRDTPAIKGTLLNLGNKAGQTPLILAIQNHHMALAQELLRLGADPNIRDQQGYTPFMAAVQRGDLETMRVLLESGRISLDHPRTLAEGWSPLHVAAAGGHEAAARWLLTVGASTSTKDNSARTPLAVAQANGHTAIIQLLRNAPQQQGYAPTGPGGYAAPAPGYGLAGKGGAGYQLLAEEEGVYQGRQQQAAGAAWAGPWAAGGPGAAQVHGGAPAGSFGGPAPSAPSLAEQMALRQQQLEQGGLQGGAYPRLEGAPVYY